MSRKRAIRVELWQRVETAVQILAEGVSLQRELQWRMNLSGGAIDRLVKALLEERLAER